MDLLATLPAFVAAILLIALTPGPGMALVVRRSALGGFRAGAPVVLGLEAAVYAWALLAGAGLAAVVAASELAYTTLRVVGAAVLLGLGLLAWRSAWRQRRGERASPPGATSPTAPSAAPAPAAVRPWRGLALGAVTNLANPKLAVFMFAFYPQFVPADRPALATAAALAALQVAIETVLYLGLAAGVGRARAWFLRVEVRRRFDVLSGSVLVALGVRVAAEPG